MAKGIAFIGTRELDQRPKEVSNLYIRAVAASVLAGYKIVTGAAKGADQVAAELALFSGGKVDLKLPWHAYEREWWQHQQALYPGQLDIQIYNEDQDDDWTASVYKYHPNPDALTNGAFALHARNYGIISRASTVIAVSNPNKPGGGGTGQGIRIARALRVRCFDLSVPDEFDSVVRRLSQLNKGQPQ